MDRRDFLRTATVAVSASALSGSLWRDAMAAPAQPGASPYGALQPADANGLQLPRGFVSRVLARSGQRVGALSYRWHPAPDGGATFLDGTGGWYYVSNSEVRPNGGASAIRFNSTGHVVAAHRILSGTNVNCAGGRTPWATWLSCEEIALGRVFECDPAGRRPAVARHAMGRFKHEAAAADPVRKVVYLTEDEPDGCFYRFRPTTWGDLSRGTLEVLCGPAGLGPVTWKRVPDPDGQPTVTRKQVAAAKRFNGGEGCFWVDGSCFFTTKGDGRVWRYDTSASRLDLVYQEPSTGGPLRGVDNIVGSRARDLFVAEDGGSMAITMITRENTVAQFLRVTGQASSEITGPAFSPDGSRLYFSSQRGTAGVSGGGITYEVRGPFRDKL